jgi:hypothetical protein
MARQRRLAPHPVAFALVALVELTALLLVSCHTRQCLNQVVCEGLFSRGNTSMYRLLEKDKNRF